MAAHKPFVRAAGADPTVTAPAAAPLPILRPSSLPAGCRWREVDTPLQRIGFMFRTSRRKTVGLTIKDDGLLVTAPSWVTSRQVDHVIHAKAPWILSKLAALHQRQRHRASEDSRWRDGGHFPYLGKRIDLLVRPELNRARFSGDADHPTDSDTLCLPLASDTAADRVRQHVYAWLQQQARKHFRTRLEHYCVLAGVRLQAWRLASPAARWGSCSSDGRIMLNWRLIHFPDAIVDYVVAHEVAHLRHMNHGPDFWREVEKLCPDFGRARQALKPHHPGSLPVF